MNNISKPVNMAFMLLNYCMLLSEVIALHSLRMMIGRQMRYSPSSRINHLCLPAIYQLSTTYCTTHLVIYCTTQRLDYIHNSPQVDAGLAVLHQEDTWLVLCPLHTLYCNPTSGVRPANKWVCWEEERGTLAVTGINNSMKV